MINDLVKKYIDNIPSQNKLWNPIAEKREASIPELREIVKKFTEESQSLRDFYEALNNTPYFNTTCWGTAGPALLMEMHRLCQYHAQDSSQDQLQKAFKNLRTNAVGERIQEFHSFLEHEQTRLTKDRIVS